MTTLNPRRRGIAAVEILVLAGVSLIGLALCAQAIHAGQIFARRARTENNLKVLALATLNYEAAHGAFPMSAVASTNPKQRGVGHSGFTQILPYLEEIRVYNAYNFDLEPWDVSNSTSVSTTVSSYLVVENPDVAPKAADRIKRLDGATPPGGNKFAPLHFGMNWGGGHKGFGDDFAKSKGIYKGVFMTVLDEDGRQGGARNVRIADITDGTSFTLGIVEKRDSAGWAVGGFGGSEFDAHESPAYQGDDERMKRVFPGSSIEAGTRAMLLDGSVRTLRPALERTVWYALITRDGGEAIDPNLWR